MYDVFKKHRTLKLVGLTVGLFLLWFLAKPAYDLISGRSYEVSSLTGTYANGKEHQVTILEEGIGKMVAGSISEDFFFKYSEGTLSCEGTNYVWGMKVLGDGSLWNEYDSSYLFKRTTE
jgi:hypothetical protein